MLAEGGIDGGVEEVSELAIFVRSEGVATGCVGAKGDRGNFGDGGYFLFGGGFFGGFGFGIGRGGGFVGGGDVVELHLRGFGLWNGGLVRLPFSGLVLILRWFRSVLLLA